MDLFLFNGMASGFSQPDFWYVAPHLVDWRCQAFEALLDASQDGM